MLKILVINTYLTMAARFQNRITADLKQFLYLNIENDEMYSYSEKQPFFLKLNLSSIEVSWGCLETPKQCS